MHSLSWYYSMKRFATGRWNYISNKGSNAEGNIIKIIKKETKKKSWLIQSSSDIFGKCSKLINFNRFVLREQLARLNWLADVQRTFLNEHFPHWVQDTEHFHQHLGVRWDRIQANNDLWRSHLVLQEFLRWSSLPLLL